MPEANVVAPVVPAAAPAPVIGTPEYDAAMVARYEASKALDPATPVVPPVAPTRPTNLPEKFWDDKAADPIAAGYAKMAESYAALEAKASGKPAVEPVAPKVDAKTGLEIKPAASDAAGDAGAKSAVEAAGLDLTTLDAEFKADGVLKPESYAAFEKIGLPKQYVDNYIAGMQALQSQFEAKAHAAAGSAENYSKMTAWASVNLKPAELNAFNGAVNGTAEQMEMAVGSLRGRYEAATGTTPQLLNGGFNNTTEGFASMAEQTAAINLKDAAGKRVYDKDPAYRAKVSARIAASTF